jgi:hypothetical protein
MFTTRIRTTMIALVASVSFGAAALAPAVSQAAKNNGGYSKSNEAAKAKMHESLCEGLGKDFEKEVEAASKAYESKGASSAAFKEAMEMASTYLELAKGEYCGWSASARLPSGHHHISGISSPSQGLHPRSR